MDSNVTAGIFAASIYWSDEYFDKISQKASSFIKNSSLNDLKVSCLDTTFNAAMSVQNTKYSLKVVQYLSERKYVIVSGNKMATVYMIERQKKAMFFNWNCKKYSINFDKLGTKVNLCINGTNVTIIKSKDIEGALHLQLPDKEESKIDDLNAFFNSHTNMKSILDGYCLPDPFFAKVLKSNLDKLFSMLRFPRLPVLRFEAIFQDLVKFNHNWTPLFQSISRILSDYASNSSSLLTKFPAQQIRSATEEFIKDTIPCNESEEVVNLKKQLQPIFTLSHLYSGGDRAYARIIIEELLMHYYDVESKFMNVDKYDKSKVIKTLSASTNPNPIIFTPSDLLSHFKLSYKNRLVIGIIEYTERYLPGVIIDLKPTLCKLINNLSKNNEESENDNENVNHDNKSEESLGNRKYSYYLKYGKLLSKLRKAISISELPSYEIHRNQIESILLSDDSKKIESLICSNSEFFDVIFEFFYKSNKKISKCALEVYIRRAYSAYYLDSFEHFELNSGNIGVFYKYNSESDSHLNKSRLKRSLSVVNIQHVHGPYKKYSTSTTEFWQDDLLKTPTRENMHDKTKLPSNNPTFIYDPHSTLTPTQSAIVTPNIRSNMIAFSNGLGGVSDNDTDSAISLGACSLSDESDLSHLNSNVLPYGVSNNSNNDVLHRNVSSTSSLENAIITRKNDKNNYGESFNSITTFSSLSNDNFDSLGSVNSLNKIESYRKFGHRFSIAEVKPNFGHSYHFQSESDIILKRPNDSLMNANWDFTDDFYPQNTTNELGVAIVFQTFDDLVQNVNSLFERVSNGCSCKHSQQDFMKYSSFSDDVESQNITLVSLNIILNDPKITTGALSNDEVSELFHQFCSDNTNDLRIYHVHRVTFILKALEKNLRYFTFTNNVDSKKEFEEDRLIRQIDPALSFQLEIDRLHFYQIEILSVPNPRMHVYLGKYGSNHQATNQLLSTTKNYRVFVRSIIYHNDLKNSTASLDTLAQQAEHCLTDAMDSIEIVCSDDPRIQSTNSNHLFFCFQSVLCIERLQELENVVKKIVLKYGKRLWRCKITQAELKMTVRLIKSKTNSYSAQMPIRMWVHNEGGKSLDICTYREEINKSLGGTKVLVTIPTSYSSYESLNNPGNNGMTISHLGRYHGLQVHHFYSL